MQLRSSDRHSYRPVDTRNVLPLVRVVARRYRLSQESTDCAELSALLDPRAAGIYRSIVRSLIPR